MIKAGKNLGIEDTLLTTIVKHKIEGEIAEEFSILINESSLKKEVITKIEEFEAYKREERAHNIENTRYISAFSYNFGSTKRPFIKMVYDGQDRHSSPKKTGHFSKFKISSN